jgi:hypothetical protein
MLQSASGCGSSLGWASVAMKLLAFFTSCKHFGLLNIQQMGLEVTRTVSHDGGTLSCFIHGTSCLVLSIVFSVQDFAVFLSFQLVCNSLCVCCAWMYCNSLHALLHSFL